MLAATDLAPPVLLLATPQVLDPFFHHSVILLVHHSDEGSFGFIVNRVTGIKVREILQGMEITWRGEPDTATHFGGPVQPQMGTVLFDEASAPPDLTESEETTTRVAPGLCITQHMGDLERLAAMPPDRFRLFLGYAGWGPGQLMEEILRNDWLTAPVTEELLFFADHESVWEESLAAVGVEPAALASWPMVDEDDTTN